MPDAALIQIAGDLQDMEGRFLSSGTLGLHLGVDDRSQFMGLIMEAKSIIDAELPLSEFGHALSMVLLSARTPHPWSSPPSVDELKTARVAIETAVRHIRRKRGTPKPPIGGPIQSPFVSPVRLLQLQSASSESWDVARLVRLCEELNVAHASGCLMATAMLGRAIMDHIPPIFGKSNFMEVANSHKAGGRTGQSFKESMESLQKSVRPIADSHLHFQIRRREVLPSPQQVEFGRDLDVLLGEIVRLLKEP